MKPPSMHSPSKVKNKTVLARKGNATSLPLDILKGERQNIPCNRHVKNLDESTGHPRSQTFQTEAVISEVSDKIASLFDTASSESRHAGLTMPQNASSLISTHPNSSLAKKRSSELHCTLIVSPSRGSSKPVAVAPSDHNSLIPDPPSRKRRSNGMFELKDNLKNYGLIISVAPQSLAKVQRLDIPLSKKPRDSEASSSALLPFSVRCLSSGGPSQTAQCSSINTVQTNHQTGNVINIQSSPPETFTPFGSHGDDISFSASSLKAEAHSETKAHQNPKGRPQQPESTSSKKYGLFEMTGGRGTYSSVTINGSLPGPFILNSNRAFEPLSSASDGGFFVSEDESSYAYSKPDSSIKSESGNASDTSNYSDEFNVRRKRKKAHLPTTCERGPARRSRRLSKWPPDYYRPDSQTSVDRRMIKELQQPLSTPRAKEKASRSQPQASKSNRPDPVRFPQLFEPARNREPVTCKLDLPSYFDQPEADKPSYDGFKDYYRANPGRSGKESKSDLDPQARFKKGLEHFLLCKEHRERRQFVAHAADILNDNIMFSWHPSSKKKWENIGKQPKSPHGKGKKAGKSNGSESNGKTIEKSVVQLKKGVKKLKKGVDRVEKGVKDVNRKVDDLDETTKGLEHAVAGRQRVSRPLSVPVL